MKQNSLADATQNQNFGPTVSQSTRMDTLAALDVQGLQSNGFLQEFEQSTENDSRIPRQKLQPMSGTNKPDLRILDENDDASLEAFSEFSPIAAAPNTRTKLADADSTDTNATDTNFTDANITDVHLTSSHLSGTPLSARVQPKGVPQGMNADVPTGQMSAVFADTVQAVQLSAALELSQTNSRRSPPIDNVPLKTLMGSAPRQNLESMPALIKNDTAKLTPPHKTDIPANVQWSNTELAGALNSQQAVPHLPIEVKQQAGRQIIANGHGLEPIKIDLPKPDLTTTDIPKPDLPKSDLKSAPSAQITPLDNLAKLSASPFPMSNGQAVISQIGNVITLNAPKLMFALSSAHTSLGPGHPQTPKPIIVQLSPAELGRVNIQFSFEGSEKITAHVNTEHAETGTLLKHNSDLLITYLKRSGFENIDLNFDAKPEKGFSDFGQNTSKNNSALFTSSGDQPPHRPPYGRQGTEHETFSHAAFPNTTPEGQPVIARPRHSNADPQRDQLDITI